jgi:flagellin-like protein
MGGHNLDDGSSNTIGTILLVVITVILAALLALILLSYQFPELTGPKEIPTIFEIQTILSEKPDYDSRIVLKNIGDCSYENDYLLCRIYINNKMSGCVIKTMNGHDFISTHHYGVQTIGGMGCSDIAWNPSEKLAIDLSDSTIREGDHVRVDVIWAPTGTTISTDEYYMN